jgi:hypothetical protein
MNPSPEIREWLLDGDSAIRWQTMQHLFDMAPSTVDRERAKVATTGWGRQLLDHQDPEGTFAGTLYSPKWISTTYSLLLLWRMGLPPTNPAGRKAVACLWDPVDTKAGVSLPNASYPPDICISAFWLTLAGYFRHEDPRVPAVVDWVLANQLSDGGWNCATVRTGSEHSSFHTTIQVLEALAQFDDPALEQAASRGREFFLDHRLFRSHRTGEVSHPAYTKFSFPPRWHYDVLRGLDYFQSVATPRDERLDDALAVLLSKRRKDGRWPVQNKHSGRVWFDMETGRQPSRWNTLRALRVLRWAKVRA